MNSIELDKFMDKINWENVSPKFLERALKEYKIREVESEDIDIENNSIEELQRLYYGVPVVFPRKKHAYKIAIDKLRSDESV